MYLFVAVTAKGDKAVQVVKFIANNGPPIHLIADMMYFQRISGTANPAFVPVT